MKGWVEGMQGSPGVVLLLAPDVALFENRTLLWMRSAIFWSLLCRNVFVRVRYDKGSQGARKSCTRESY